MTEVTCHCGAVHLTVPQAPTEVTECNCSVCRRLGARWAYYTPSEVSVAQVGSTHPYVWGDRMLAFHRCRRCGCVTHWQSLSVQPRMAINARMIDGLDWTKVRIRQFDGDKTWAYLETPGGEAHIA
ncbi:MAG: GFA family protein [Phenylobacterium sp.]|uniref:GFA family protein n=1 Tax=Phenylobacterium sp. TaxID=1871053 RepID=UPI002733C16B|nr:GFA family protein [Phenylobacterium sp.]MDP3172847.1 GFA family protein [Phenylobacterium sp.]